jgi:hypothetical protein
MNKKEQINEMLKQKGQSSLYADGYDEAILGADSISGRIIYSVKKCYEVLMERDGMPYDEAVEFFAFNTLGAYMGKETPIWCFDLWE